MPAKIPTGARCLALAALLATTATPARADLWVWVDESGRSHFAPAQVDARYTLFYKGRTSLDPPPPAPAPPPAPPDPSVAASEALRDHPIHRRVDGHPNVARYEPLVADHAGRNGLDPALVKAVIAVESAYDPAAVSEKGAVGLMQVMPDTGARYGVAGDARRSTADKLKEPAINVRVGTRYLKDLLERYAGDLSLALAAYNAGEGVVDRMRGVPPYSETREYLRLVGLFHDWYRPSPPAPPPEAGATARPSATGRITLERARSAPR